MADLLHLFLSYFTTGGFVMVPIFFVSVVGWYIGIEKLFRIRRIRRARTRFLQSMQTLLRGGDSRDSTGVDYFDTMLHEVRDVVRHPHQQANFCVMFREFLMHSVPDINSKLTTMAAWTSVAPLLGLLGTVTGMIRTFQVITEYGLGNPTLTAEGISIALITTQAGLTAAFPLLLFNNFLQNKAYALRAALFTDGEELVSMIHSKGDLGLYV
jgi:biopolymer transport protein ExbB